MTMGCYDLTLRWECIRKDNARRGVSLGKMVLSERVKRISCNVHDGALKATGGRGRGIQRDPFEQRSSPDPHRF